MSSEITEMWWETCIFRGHIVIVKQAIQNNIRSSLKYITYITLAWAFLEVSHNDDTLFVNKVQAYSWVSVSYLFLSLSLFVAKSADLPD